MVDTQKTNDGSDLTPEQQIIRAASEVFVLKGFAGARMQEIADKAGMNKALLHYYFRSKDKLFTAVFSVVVREMIENLAEIFESDDSVFDKIRSFFREHQSILQKNYLLPLFMLNEIHRDPNLIMSVYRSDGVQQVGDSFFADILREQDAGIIRPEVVPMDLFVNILSLSIFPFAARPLFIGFYNISDDEFKEMIDSRKEGLADFVIESIKVKK